MSRLLCCDRCGRHINMHYGNGLYCSGDGPFAFQRFVPGFSSWLARWFS